MTLVDDDIYLPVMMKYFSLVENESQLMNVPVIVEALGLVLLSVLLLIHYGTLIMLLL